MTRFNESVKGKYTDPAKAETTNHEGAPAYTLGNELELYSLVCTSLLADKFYTGKEKDLDRLLKLVRSCRPEFVAKLGVYAREEMHLRSIPMVLAVELARATKGNGSGSLVRRMVSRVVQRCDEITEILSYYTVANQDPLKKKPLAKIANQVKLGLADSFAKFDEYQMGKYKQEDKAITLRDALFVCHPKPANPEQEALYKKLADKTLETPFTWETELSAKGNKPEVWDALVASKKMGYMATLRNLRNMLNAGVADATIDSVCAYLASESAVLKSKQLPFRFFSAYRELIGEKTKNLDRRVTEALETAALISAKNINGFDPKDRVLIACDTSGSMGPPISEKSSVARYEVGLVLGSYLFSVVNKCQAGIFGEEWLPVNLPTSQILANTKRLSGFMGKVGHATNGWKVLDWAIKNGQKFNRVVFFTDCQWWDTEADFYASRLVPGGHAPAKLWAQYKQIVPDASAYFVDLAGYGNTPIKAGKNDVWFVAGWNERMFEAIKAIEQGRDALSLIEAVVL